MRLDLNRLTPSLAREARELIESRRRAGRPVKVRFHALARATYVPSSTVEFDALRARLRDGDYARPSEWLDRVEHALKALHGHGFPLPNELIQHEDGALALFWRGVSIRVQAEGIAYLIGGARGSQGLGAPKELLDAIALVAKLKQ